MWRPLIGCLVALTMILAACGGDDDAASDSTPQAMEERDSADVATDDDVAPDSEIDGLVVVSGLSAGHERGELDYDRIPPVGGNHNPFWQKCGYYSVAVPTERAVHAMEHGAVWIAYQPSLDASSLEAQASAESHLLISPVEGLSAPIVASAWGAQVALDGIDDPRLQQFIDVFIRQGPERADCVGGGVGQPPDNAGPGLDI